jgi:hypothetical protein
MEIDTWIKEIIHGSGGFETWEDREMVVHNVSREYSIAAFVIRALSNPVCTGSEDILEAISAQREKNAKVIKQHF